MRERFLKAIARQAALHPWKILAAALIITTVAAVMSLRLEVSLRWSDLMPESDPRAVEFNRVLEKYRSASAIMVLFRGDERRIKAFADEAAPAVAAIQGTYDGKRERLIKRVMYKEDDDFIRDHGLMLMKSRDLENVEDLFRDVNLPGLLTHINDNLEKTYIYTGDEGKLSRREESDNALRYLDGLKSWLEAIEGTLGDPYTSSDAVAKAADELLIGDPYMLSYDHRYLLLFAYPTFPVTDSERGNAACDSIENILRRISVKYPGVETGLTGMSAMSRDEFRAVQSDMNYLTLVALVLIFLLFVLSFRMLVAPFYALIALIVGVVWTAGFAAVAVGTLNIMTAMFAVILIGLGIDFSVHIISGFTEHRSRGSGVAEATEETLLKAGPGITTGGLTTGIAFLTLIISDSRGMHDFGLIAGVGVILCMIASLVVLPPLLVLQERRREGKTRAARKTAAEFRLLGSIAVVLGKGRWAALGGMTLLTVFFVQQAGELRFDYDMLNIEPKDMESVVWYDSLMAAFDMSPDYALVTSSSLDSIRVIAERAKDFPNIAHVDAVTNYLPAEEEQEKRARIISRIRESLQKQTTARTLTPEDLATVIEQLQRLWMNIAEMSELAFQAGQDRLEAKTYELVSNPDQEGSPDYIQSLSEKLKADPGAALRGLNRFQMGHFNRFRTIALRMANPAFITPDNLPRSILERYLSDDGSTYLVSIYPEKDLWNMDNLKAFDRQLKSISPRATGTPSLFLAMIEILGRDGKRATVIAFFTILLLLFLDFRRLDHALLATLPLVTGAFWMAGILHLAGQKLNVVNIEAIPLILGIGIDYGVHLIHRYRIEGKGKVRRIFSSTGKAILLSALTTMIGFGSLSFMVHRGMASLGVLLFIGVGACFLTAVGWLAPIFSFSGARTRK